MSLHILQSSLSATGPTQTLIYTLMYHNDQRGHPARSVSTTYHNGLMPIIEQETGGRARVTEYARIGLTSQMWHKETSDER